jgi:hypothetical protein
MRGKSRCEGCKAPCDYWLLGQKYDDWVRLKIQGSCGTAEVILCHRCANKPVNVKQLYANRDRPPEFVGVPAASASVNVTNVSKYDILTDDCRNQILVKQFAAAEKMLQSVKEAGNSHPIITALQEYPQTKEPDQRVMRMVEEGYYRPGQRIFNTENEKKGRVVSLCHGRSPACPAAYNVDWGEGLVDWVYEDYLAIDMDPSHLYKEGQQVVITYPDVQNFKGRILATIPSKEYGDIQYQVNCDGHYVIVHEKHLLSERQDQ